MLAQVPPEHNITALHTSTPQVSFPFIKLQLHVLLVAVYF
jgi:hypothetical protein